MTDNKKHRTRFIVRIDNLNKNTRTELTAARAKLIKS